MLSRNVCKELPLIAAEAWNHAWRERQFWKFLYQLLYCVLSYQNIDAWQFVRWLHLANVNGEPAQSLWFPFCNKVINHYECVSVFLPSLYRKEIPSSLPLLYCSLRPIWLYHIFQYFLTNGTTGRKQFFENKLYVVILSTNFIKNICHSRK
jgi:hypothetical protein